MTKSNIIKRSTVSGRISVSPLGKKKASRFALVEGMTLTKKWERTIALHESEGLKGDALRSAISRSFSKKSR
ncbi:MULTISPECIES: hypothetical protein [unclassified Pseudovibrio]|uniref:hypothetical protein n=1 Tax=unclassified Pseudovibrio TaxID=2627060 RepID=UPI000A8C5D68|nr:MULTISPECIES: hypothetical protein [unclassified Pseudovibrio]